MTLDEGLAFLERWLTDHCDGEWESEFGIALTTSECGWHLRVDLVDTELDGRTARMDPADPEGPDWFDVHSDGRHFDASCSLGNLAPVLEAFADFAQADFEH